MSILQRAASLTVHFSRAVNRFGNKSGNFKKALVPVLFLQASSEFQENYEQICPFSTVDLNKSMQLIVQEDKKPKVEPKSLAVQQSTENQEKPLALILSWLMAKKRHLRKYAQFYLDQGFDVLTIQVTPWQMLWPIKGVKLVASDVLTFLHSNPYYESSMVHGFSVGGYLWGEVLAKIAQNQEKYLPVADRFIGQVWDSVVDVQGIPTGFPKAVFPNNAVLRKSLERYTRYHLKKFHDVATVHYLASSHHFHNTIVKAPALFLMSQDDPVGSAERIYQTTEEWENAGIRVFLKCWDSSPHVSHLHFHPAEYRAEISAFLNHLGQLPYPERLAIKV